MILRCEAIFCRAAASILVSSVSSFSSALRASCRIVLRSSRKSHFVDLGQGIGHRVGQFVQLVARDSHSTALYLRASSFFTFLNISG